MKRLPKQLLFLLSLTFLFSTCSKDESISNPIQENETIPAGKTTIIESNDWNNAITNVDNTNYTFTFKKTLLDKYSLEVGDILIGKEDGGYLRKVKKIVESGENIDIETEFATITQAFEELHETASAKFSPNFESNEFWVSKGVTLKANKSAKLNENLVDFEIKEILFDIDGDETTTTNDQVRINGSYKLDVNFDSDIDISGANIEKIMLEYEIQQTKHIEGYIGISVPDSPKRIAHIPGHDILAGPLTIQPVLEVFIGYSGDLSAPIEMSYDEQINNKTTIITYDGYNWDKNKTRNEIETFEKPTLEGELNAKIYLKAEISFRIYRVVSPKIDMELYGRTKVEYDSGNFDWETSLGVDIGMGVDLTIFNSKYPLFYESIYSWENTINNGQEEATEGTFIDSKDNQVYKWVKIGDQIWMAENLKATTYQNGDNIPNVTDNTEWANLTSGAYSVYDNSSSNGDTYGNLYNWFSVNDTRKISPEGWHIPSDEEWKKLEMYLGMSSIEVNTEGYRGTSEGGKLKETGFTHWYSPNTGATNSSGITALPGGFIDVNGFGSLGAVGYWWSSTESTNSSVALSRGVRYDVETINRNNIPKQTGLSVICVKD